MSVPFHFDLGQIEATLRDLGKRNFAESRTMPDADHPLIDLQEELFEVEITANLWHAKAQNEGRDPEIIVQSFVAIFGNTLSCIASNLVGGNPVTAVLLARHMAREASVVAASHLLGTPREGMTQDHASVAGTRGGNA